MFIILVSVIPLLATYHLEMINVQRLLLEFYLKLQPNIRNSLKNQQWGMVIMVPEKEWSQ